MTPMATKVWLLCTFAGFFMIQTRLVFSLCSNEYHFSLTAGRNVAGASPSAEFSNLSRYGNPCLSLTICHDDSGTSKLSKRKSRINSLALCNAYHGDFEKISNDATSDVVVLDATSSAESTPSHSKPNTGSTAIILNMNARHVTPYFISIASEIVGEKNVFVTETADDATLAARTVVRGTSGSKDSPEGAEAMHKYSLVIPVGGDGTLSGWINSMVDEILLLQKLENDTNMTVNDAMKQLPCVGYVPMGTGNGLGYVVGCKYDSKASNNEVRRKSLFSRMNVFTYSKRRKLQHVAGVMRRLKEVGDAIQQAEQMNPLSDIENELSGLCSIVEMPMMEVTHGTDSIIDTDKKGDLCFFAGAGFDSLMLHDFQQIKAWSQSARRAPTFVKEALSSVGGYCVALITKTLPQTVRYGTHKIHVKVVTKDTDTLWVDHRRGDFSELAVRPRTLSRGLNDERVDVRTDTGSSAEHLIYSGTTGIIAASTTPYYGGGLRLFPYARLIPDKLQLRIGRISPLTGFFNIPQIFEGSYREKSESSFGCLDFIGRDFEVELRSERYEDFIRNKSRKKQNREQSSWMPWRNSKKSNRRDNVQVDVGNDENDDQQLVSSGFPFQHSGESMGIKDRFQIRLVQEPVKFISFLKPRVLLDD